jgi:hypothetical protein
MRIVLKIVAGLIAAGLLVLAGVVLGIPQQYPGDNAGLWIAAAVLAALALAARPPVGRQHPWLIAGLVVLAGISFFEGVNYRFWYDNREERIDRGFWSDLSGIKVHVTRDDASIFVPGKTVSAGGSLRLLTPQELRLREQASVSGVKITDTTLLIDWPPMSRQTTSLHFNFADTAIRPGVLADDYPDRVAEAAQKRLSDHVTVFGQHFRTVLSNCQGEVMPGRPSSAPDGQTAALIMVRPDFGKAPANCGAHGDGMPLDDFLAKIAAETSVTVELAGSDGKTVLTAVIPTQRLTEALRVKAKLDDHIRRKDVGEPFSPFVAYRPSTIF